jgi:catechol 2,3-dioxygenase-like lactoylglutathione lyase family enzyme
MIHHVSLGANDIGRAKAFYEPIMALLGFRLLRANDQALDFGIGDIVFSIETPLNGKPANPGNGVHIAFSAIDRDMVNRFHVLGLSLGGADAGAPGLRPGYDAHYYGAFLFDPEGNKIEAVTYSAS